MKKHFLILVFLLIFLSGCSSQPGAWGWYVIDPTTKGGYNNVMFLLSGFSATIQLSLSSIFLYYFRACCGFARHVK